MDRSVLAQNVYAAILRPAGFSLFTFKTLRELKERRWFQRSIRLLLINSNTFGHYLETHLEWFQTYPEVVALPKIFLCDPNEKKVLQNLKKISHSQIVHRPFYPSVLTKKIYESL